MLTKKKEREHTIKSHVYFLIYSSNISLFESLVKLQKWEVGTHCKF